MTLLKGMLDALAVVFPSNHTSQGIPKREFGKKSIMKQNFRFISLVFKVALHGFTITKAMIQ